MLTNSITRLRIIGFLEGASFLLLLGIAMPLKYLAGMPEMVRIVGSAHGILFLLYVLALVTAAAEFRWPLRKVGIGLVAAVLPAGPFVFDRRLREEPVSPPRATGAAA